MEETEAVVEQTETVPVEQTEIETEELINNQSINDIFAKMMKILEGVVAGITYATFFKGQLTCKGVRGNRLILEAPSFMVSVIKERFSAVVDDALEQASEGRLFCCELEGK